MLSMAAALAGCPKDEPGKLFEEEGVWSLLRYDTGDGLQELNPSTAKDAFLLKFETGPKVVTAAACGSETDNVPGESTCRQNHSSTFWTCRCFAYAYEEEVMQWREFTAGEPPPSVDFMQPTAAEGGGGDETATGGGGGDDYITLSTVGTSSETYGFTPLPMGVFGSDGTASRYEFVQRAGSVFEGPAMNDNAPLIDPQGMCTPCVN